MSMFKHTPERLLLTALIGALLSWAWNLRLLTQNPLGDGWDWVVSTPFMLLLSLLGCLLVSRIWGDARGPQQSHRHAALDDL